MKDDRGRKRAEFKKIIRYLAQCGLPFIIGGRFQPRRQRCTNLLDGEGVPAMVQEPKVWTCKANGSKSRIDVFVISKALSRLKFTAAERIFG